MVEAYSFDSDIMNDTMKTKKSEYLLTLTVLITVAVCFEYQIANLSIFRFAYFLYAVIEC